jgi:FAD/FMN-containing dehydrogenase
MHKHSKLLIALLVLGVFVVVAPPVVFLTSVWWRDGNTALTDAPVGTNDASRLNDNHPAEVVEIASDPEAAERQLSDLVRRAASQGSHVSISGARHSMGGHTIYPGAIVLDMLPFNRMSLNESARILTVGAGARWSEIIPFLDHRGFAVSIMQSNNDFTVGGSLSVNCHGWQNNAPPISSSVESFRLLNATGNIVRCSRTENEKLFSLVLGGYGLFGVMLEVNLHVVPNEFYAAEAYQVGPADYNQKYHELTSNKPDVGMAYGRISVAPGSFMNEAIITLLKRRDAGGSVSDTLTAGRALLLKRLVFRAGVESSYGKNLRWWLEKRMGETGNTPHSRNQIMNEPSVEYATRDPATTDILHEYFIPTSRLGEFVEKSRPVFLRYHPELLNITVRNVEPDKDTFLSYAHQEVFGLVMLFHQKRDSAGELGMKNLTRELIDVALSCGGTYYLPYRAHATEDQFLRGYPQARAFVAQKLLSDPAGVFSNEFYLNYGKALE